MTIYLYICMNLASSREYACVYYKHARLKYETIGPTGRESRAECHSSVNILRRTFFFLMYTLNESAASDADSRRPVVIAASVLFLVGSSFPSLLSDE